MDRNLSDGASVNLKSQGSIPDQEVFELMPERVNCLPKMQKQIHSQADGDWDEDHSFICTKGAVEKEQLRGQSRNSLECLVRDLSIYFIINGNQSY